MTTFARYKASVKNQEWTRSPLRCTGEGIVCVMCDACVMCECYGEGEGEVEACDMCVCDVCVRV